MIHLRPDSTAYANVKEASPAVGGLVTPDNTVLEGANPSALVQAMQTPKASITDSFKATLQQSLAAKALRGMDYLSIPSEDGFNVSQALGESVSQYTADELEFLADARSNPELQQRRSQVQSTRDNYSAMGQNLLTTVAASMLDVDMVIGGGVGALTKLTRATRLAVGLSANAGLLSLASQGGTVTPLDVVGTSVGVALSAIPGVRRAAQAAERANPEAAVAAERAAVNTSAEATPTVQAASDVAAQVVPERPAVRTVPDEDYPKIQLDTYSNKPHVEVGVSRKVGDAPELVTTVQNAVRAVVGLADDLPPEVRALGRALSSSLDAESDMPLIIRKATADANRPASKAERSFARAEADGSASVQILGNKPANSLSEHIQGLSTYNKTVILHEASHAKTMQSIRAVEMGRVTSGPVYDAVKRIGAIRAHVLENLPVGTGKSARDTAYAVRNDHEFLSQLFNSEKFRNDLKGIKMSNGNVFSEMVRHVVSLFTGKAPTGSAFDETVSAFEHLLSQPSVGREVFTRQARETPDLASPVLHAPNVQQMNSKVMGALNRNFSLYERLASYGPKASTLADQLVVDATGTSANSAAHYARAAHLASNTSIVQVDSALAQAMSADWPLMQRMRHPKAYRDAQRDLSAKVYQQLADNHERHLSGRAIQPNNDPRVNSITDAFQKSGWAEHELAALREAGVPGAADIPSSPWYLPRRHSGDKLNNYMRENPDVTADDIRGMYADQFRNMFAARGIEDATAKKLGAKMYQNLQDKASHVGGYRQSIVGMDLDEVKDILRALGAEDSTIAGFVDDLNNAGEAANKVRNLRHRVEFDTTREYQTSSGKLISPSMFINNDVMGLMEGYSRNMAGRVGLAKAGYPDLRQLTKSIDEAAAESPNAREAVRDMDNTVNQLLGYPTGEDVPDILRSASILGGALNLANSGVYQLADLGLQLQQFGFAKTLKALTSTKFGQDALELARSPEYGARLRDVLEARNVLSGKYRSVLTHLDDNRDIGSMGFAHRYVQQLGQGTRFVNGMEFIRRGQSKMVAGLIADSVDDAIGGNAKAVEALRRFGMHDDLLNRLRSATQKDPDMRTWPDSVRVEVESVAHNMADALVLENRLGEIPGWMQFSSVGKVVLPYMTFVAGTWNKILRRTAKLDGASGVAMALAYQMPLTTLAAATSMGLGNQKMTPEALVAKTITQVPMMSWLGTAVDMTVNGPTNSIAALSIVDKMHSAMSGISRGEVNPETVIKAVPFLSILPGMRLMGASMADDDE